ncbi:putative non-specific serine/threonine protein kinase [Helianthus anomalus]
MKADVYSFSMIMLELLIRKSPEDHWIGLDLPQWVAFIVKEEKTKEVFDRDLMKDASSVGESELLDSLKLALQCIHQSPQDQPDVQLVLQRLEEIRP